MKNNNRVGGGNVEKNTRDRTTELVVIVATFVNQIAPQELDEGTSTYLAELAFKFVEAEETSAGLAADGKPESLSHNAVEVAFGKVKDKIEEAELSTSAISDLWIPDPRDPPSCCTRSSSYFSMFSSEQQ